jgi:hypothetical protein
VKQIEIIKGKNKKRAAAAEKMIIPYYRGVSMLILFLLYCSKQLHMVMHTDKRVKS